MRHDPRGPRVPVAPCRPPARREKAPGIETGNGTDGLLLQSGPLPINFFCNCIGISGVPYPGFAVERMPFKASVPVAMEWDAACILGVPSTAGLSRIRSPAKRANFG